MCRAVSHGSAQVVHVTEHSLALRNFRGPLSELALHPQHLAPAQAALRQQRTQGEQKQGRRQAACGQLEPTSGTAGGKGKGPGVGHMMTAHPDGVQFMIWPG